jgi:hypothetical protein
MEIIIILVVLGLAAYWVYDMSQKKKDTEKDKLWPFGETLSEGKIHVKPADVAPGKSAEDRVEATAPKCGCGRSSTGFCVGLHKLTAEEWAVSDQNPNKAAEPKPAKKAPTKKRQFEKKPTAEKKPAAKKAPAKKKST